MLMWLVILIGVLLEESFVNSAHNFISCRDYVGQYTQGQIDDSARCRSGASIRFNGAIVIGRDVIILGGTFGDGVQILEGAELGTDIEADNGVAFGQYVCIENKNSFAASVQIPDQSMVRKTAKANDELAAADYQIISIPKFRYLLGDNGECNIAEPIPAEKRHYVDCSFHTPSTGKGLAKCDKYGAINIAGRIEVNGVLYMDSAATFNINMDGGNPSDKMSHVLVNEQTTVIVGENAHVGVLCKFNGVVAFGDNSVVANRATFKNANVGPDATIEDDCVVEGTIHQYGIMRKGAKLLQNALMEIGSILGQGSTLGPNSVLRQRHVISRESCIGSNVVVKNSLGPRTLLNAEGGPQSIPFDMQAVLEGGRCVLKPLR